ncbi:hypothetical protein [Bailinhaonella thermotolerans]|uniref:Uncharacterized protein n=1 Tax=Bailinhaonella thermotolerans TaxID=1070861 RepID=A0A3A4AWL1_9ACTN|nr:hypothetical protein [Bailinhaonella thermotolerans]RJL34660.1 hypothetical protein D5H75_07915 [Bailinhaonella thermotolerans]
MPCYRCGARQTDPARGASPWKRGVRAESQVLVCPDCQRVHDWTADLDRCEACDSATLVCRLGEIECRDCGHVRPVRRDQETAGVAPGLAEEVEAALSRVLGRLAPRP